LTTLATRKQSQIFPQHIASETPLQHVCDVLFLEKTKHVSHCVFAFSVCQKRGKTRKTKRKTENKKEQQTNTICFFISRNMYVLNQTPNAGYPTVAKPTR
jgi:hypothetical protein